MIAEQLRPLAVAISSLNEDPANLRRHDEKNLAAIKASLAAFGQRSPIVVQRQGMIVRAGNGRLAAARELGWTEIAAVVIDDDNATAMQYAIADNRTAELAEWDEDALAKVLQSLTVDQRELVGFEQADLDALLRSVGTDPLTDDDVPPAPAVPRSRLGDVWLMGEHRLMCGDATNGVHVGVLLAGAKPFLMVTDPPYGVDYDPEWRVDVGLNSAEARTGKVANDDNASWPLAYGLFPGTVAYVWHAGVHAGQVAVDLHGCNLHIRGQIIWRKERFAIGRGAYHWGHEPCWYAVRKGSSAKWCGDRSQSTVWDIQRAQVGEGREDTVTNHGTQKPIECMARPIRNHGGRDDAVYDPFLGSGTTLIACERLGRRFFGLELDPVYCDVSVARWEKVTGKVAILAGDGRCFTDVPTDRP